MSENPNTEAWLWAGNIRQRFPAPERQSLCRLRRPTGDTCETIPVTSAGPAFPGRGRDTSSTRCSAPCSRPGEGSGLFPDTGISSRLRDASVRKMDSPGWCTPRSPVRSEFHGVSPCTPNTPSSEHVPSSIAVDAAHEMSSPFSSCSFLCSAQSPIRCRSPDR